MSIDALIKAVVTHQDGSGKLVLTNRSPDSIPGPKFLRFGKTNFNTHSLVDKEIWGSNNSIFLGDVKIANRIGYTTIEFIE